MALQQKLNYVIRQQIVVKSINLPKRLVNCIDFMGLQDRIMFNFQSEYYHHALHLHLFNLINAY